MLLIILLFKICRTIRSKIICILRTAQSLWNNARFCKKWAHPNERNHDYSGSSPDQKICRKFISELKQKIQLAVDQQICDSYKKVIDNHFRGFKYSFRRVHGNHSTRNLDNIPEQLPLVKNLKNPNYMRLIFEDENKIAEKFAEVDVKIIREMEKNHYPKKKIYSSRKIKKTLRSPDFKKQLLSAFQAVAN